jgi:hypothetical protein
MESKWPFMLIAFGLVFLLGLALSGLERNNIMKHWDKRRCEFAVMAAASFFKESDDPRTNVEFAKDNFQFCMKSYVDKFMASLMAPVGMMFEKQVNVTENSLNSLQTIKSIASNLYQVFSTYMDQFYRRFQHSIYEVSRIIQYLRMAMERANTVALSMLYSGLTLFRGMLNAIQFTIRVILIICGIMIALIIVLWFVLFPVIPLVISTLGAIVTTVFMLIMVISSQVADQANKSKGPFCFEKDTLVPIRTKENKEVLVAMKDLKIGDEITNGGGIITAIIKMDGTNIPLYTVDGIKVSGSHLIKGTDGMWKSVMEDERAQMTNDTTDVLYCLNTTTHIIPLYSKESMFYFRDWEELEDNDLQGHYAWNYIVLKQLNQQSFYSNWKNSLTIATEIPLLSSNIKVKTIHGFKEMGECTMGNDDLVDSNGNRQKVIGEVQGSIEERNGGRNTWHTELWQKQGGIWIKGKSTIPHGDETVEGKNIITETGEFVIWNEEEKREMVIRDFTEIGHDAIHETYSMVASRLRIYESIV